MTVELPPRRPAASSSSRGSKIPAVASLSLITISFLFTVFRDVIRFFWKPTRLQTSTNLGLVPYVDAFHQAPYALPMFLASGILLYFGPRGIKPVMQGVSPDRVVFWIRALIWFSNIFIAAWTLLVVYVLNGPIRAGRPWQAHLETIVRRLAYPLYWNLAYLLYLAMRSPVLSPLQACLGIAYEHTIALHRTTGWWTLVLTIIHTVGYFIVYIVENELLHEFELSSGHGALNIAGLVGTIIFVLMGATSFYKVRRSNYNIFAWVHWLWPFALAFCILHIVAFAWPMIPPLALYIVDRIACLWGAGAGPAGAVTSVATAIRVSDSVVALLIPVGPGRELPSARSSQEGQTGSSSRCSVDSTTLDPLTSLDADIPLTEMDHDLINIYQPGRFLSLSFPVDLTDPASHPFSIATYSPRNRTVTMMIRALGPWSNKLHAMASEAGSPITLRVAGPFSTPALHTDTWFDGPSAMSANGKTIDSSHDIESQGSTRPSRVLVAGGVGLSKFMTLRVPETVGSVTDLEDSSTGSLKKRKGKKPVSTESIKLSHDKDGGLAMDEGTRKIWLCKDPKELAMYQALGADLSGWQIYSKLGFDLVATGSTGVRSSYPLFSQMVAAPLGRGTRLGLGLLFVSLYLAIYLASRVMISMPETTYCRRNIDIGRFLMCSRIFGMFPFLAILFVFTAAVQIATLVQMARRATLRPASMFYSHKFDTIPEGAVSRRFDMDTDLDFTHVQDKTSSASWPHWMVQAGLYLQPKVEGSVRVCAGKPVRDELRGRGASAKMVVTDDGIGF